MLLYRPRIKLINEDLILIRLMEIKTINLLKGKGMGGSMSQVVGLPNNSYKPSQVVGLPNNSYKPITNTAWVRARFFKLQKGCTRLAVASDKVSQLLAHGRWFSLASSTTKTDRHDIAEILLKVALSTKNQSIKSIERMFYVL